MQEVGGSIPPGSTTLHSEATLVASIVSETPRNSPDLNRGLSHSAQCCLLHCKRIGAGIVRRCHICLLLQLS
jgi:hypothetical protein